MREVTPTESSGTIAQQLLSLPGGDVLIATEQFDQEERRVHTFRVASPEGQLRQVIWSTPSPQKVTLQHRE